MERVKIGNKIIGENEPCFIIAEAGSNHNGSLEQAKKLIDIAVEAGADAVKFTIRSYDLLYIAHIETRYKEAFRIERRQNE